MGRNKLLLDVDGEPLVRRAVRHALQAALVPVIVVVGFEPDRVRCALQGLRYEPVWNREFEDGMGSSLALGIQCVPSACAAAVVTLSDMPLVSSEMLATVVHRYRETRAPVVCSTYGDVQAPPTLYDRSVFSDFAGEQGDGCGKRIVERHRGWITAVQWPVARLADVDRPEDYAALSARA